jgi:phage-related minor tail protein
LQQSANAVAKEFGISGAESLKFIEDGFKKGSNANGEFLEILKEYPAQFKTAGIDAETTFAIINQQVKEGIYSDKGVDAIKEGGLRLRENTKAVQDALAPLDESIKKQIEQEIASGNSFKAIQLVSEALKDTSLSAEETQKIVTDVFGGAGEDAGLRYLQTLSGIETNLDNVKNQTSSVKDATLEFTKSFNRLVLETSEGASSLGNFVAQINKQ